MCEILWTKCPFLHHLATSVVCLAPQIVGFEPETYDETEHREFSNRHPVNKCGFGASKFDGSDVIHWFLFSSLG